MEDVEDMFSELSTNIHRLILHSTLHVIAGTSVSNTQPPNELIGLF